MSFYFFVFLDNALLMLEGAGKLQKVTLADKFLIQLPPSHDSTSDSFFLAAPCILVSTHIFHSADFSDLKNSYLYL